MVQLDLITGFLGAGKTTFLRRYARYLAQTGERVCVLENDLGAVNVDALLVQELADAGCEVETITGGGDAEAPQRRLRAKLIAMAMRGFTRVVVEPSGVFDPELLFDVLRDDPLERWYQMGNVIAIVDATQTLSAQAGQVLAAECASAGLVLFSRAQQAGAQQCAAAQAQLEQALEAAHCTRRFAPEELLCKDWAALTEAEWERIASCGMRRASCEKAAAQQAFASLCFLEPGIPLETLRKTIPALLADPACGRVLRVKGFAVQQGQWLALNAAADGLTVQPAAEGQDVLIVIGEGLEKQAVEQALRGEKVHKN